MGMEQAWLMPAIALAAFVILLLAGPYLPRRGDWLAIATIGASFILFFPVLADFLDATKHQPDFIGGDKSWDWISYADFKIQLGFFVDQITILMLLFFLFMGAVGKSGQFPLHVWLPDAMEGPTPVSALIHAATMVVAGVYMVARMLPLFEVAEPIALDVVTILGLTTVMLSATMGLAATDIKRVIAYSTLNSLGL